MPTGDRSYNDHEVFVIFHAEAEIRYLIPVCDIQIECMDTQIVCFVTEIDQGPQLAGGRTRMK